MLRAGREAWAGKDPSREMQQQDTLKCTQTHKDAHAPTCTQRDTNSRTRESADKHTRMHTCTPLVHVHSQQHQILCQGTFKSTRVPHHWVCHCLHLLRAIQLVHQRQCELESCARPLAGGQLAIHHHSALNSAAGKTEDNDLNFPVQAGHERQFSMQMHD